MMTEASIKNRAKQQVYAQMERMGVIGKEGSGAAIERLGPKQEFVKIIDKDLVPALKEALAVKKTPVFIDFRIDRHENVFPMIPPGKMATDIIE